MAGKLIRSLSGAHVRFLFTCSVRLSHSLCTCHQMSSPADCHLNNMLQSMATGSEGEGKSLLDRLVPASHSTAGVTPHTLQAT